MFVLVSATTFKDKSDAFSQNYSQKTPAAGLDNFNIYETIGTKKKWGSLYNVGTGELQIQRSCVYGHNFNDT